MDFSPPGSSVHWISQERILQWVAISSSKGSSQSRDQTRISCMISRFFTTELPRKPIRNVHVALGLYQGLCWPLSDNRKQNQTRTSLLRAQPLHRRRPWKSFSVPGPQSLGCPLYGSSEKSMCLHDCFPSLAESSPRGRLQSTQLFFPRLYSGSDTHGSSINVCPMSHSSFMSP